MSEDDGLELTIEFRERFTVHPPEEIDDPVHARAWFWDIYSQIGRDVIDTSRKDHYEILAVLPEGFDA